MRQVFCFKVIVRKARDEMCRRLLLKKKSGADMEELLPDSGS
jgi:hypothetical protein